MTKKSREHQGSNQHINNLFLQETNIRAEAQKFQETKFQKTNYYEEKELEKTDRGKPKLLYSLTDSFEM